MDKPNSNYSVQTTPTPIKIKNIYNNMNPTPTLRYPEESANPNYKIVKNSTLRYPEESKNSNYKTDKIPIFRYPEEST